MFYFLFSLLGILIKIDNIKLFIIFIVLNLFLILSSNWFVNNFKNPYNNQSRIEQVNIYNDFCDKVDSKIMKFFLIVKMKIQINNIFKKYIF